MKKLYILLLCVIAVLALAGFVFWRYFYLATIAIEPTPSNAIITVNGVAVPDRTLHLRKGSYTITVGLPGYRTETFTARVGYGSQLTKTIALVALPQPTKLLNGPLNSLSVSSDLKNVFFEHANSLYNYSLTGPAGLPPVQITPTLDSITQVDWAPNYQLALIHKSNSEIGLYDFKRYDLLHQEYRPLDSNIKQAVWSPDNSGFFAEYDNTQTGEHSLVKLDATGSSMTRLAGLSGFPLTNFSMTAISPSMLILSGTDLKQPGDIVLFDTSQKIFNPITDSSRAYSPIVSPDHTKIAFLDNGELTVADADGKNKRNLNIRPKDNNYTFSSDNTLFAFTPNLVTAINTANGNATKYEVYAPSDAIRNLFASSDGKTLYYSYQNTLYQLAYTGTKAQ